MKLPRLFFSIALASTILGTPVFADSDRDHRRGPPHHQHDDRRDHSRHDRRDDDRRHWDRSRHHRGDDAHRREEARNLERQLERERARRIAAERELRHERQRVGEHLRRERYQRISDLDRYNLQRNDNWSYYQQDDQIYQVNNKTQQIMSIMNLVGMLAR
jgi:hypothetical protein